MVSGARLRAFVMSGIAIIAALSGELKPLVRGWERRGRNLWTGRVAENDVIAVAGGIGAWLGRSSGAREHEVDDPSKR